MRHAMLIVLFILAGVSLSASAEFQTLRPKAVQREYETKVTGLLVQLERTRPIAASELDQHYGLEALCDLGERRSHEQSLFLPMRAQKALCRKRACAAVAHPFVPAHAHIDPDSALRMDARHPAEAARVPRSFIAARL